MGGTEAPLTIATLAVGQNPPLLTQAVAENSFYQKNKQIVSLVCLPAPELAGEGSVNP